MNEFIIRFLVALFSDFVWLSFLVAGSTWWYYRKYLMQTGRHQLNRMLLLGVTFLPFLIFFVQSLLPTPRFADLYPIQVGEYLIGGRAGSGSLHPGWTVERYLLMFSFLSLIVMLFKSGIWLANYYHVRETIRKQKKSWREGICYVEAPQGMPIGSFGKFVFWRETEGLTEEMDAQLRAHEECHVIRKHSRDILWMDIILIFFWYNPFMYLIRRELRQIHEFQADEAALNVGSEQSYRALLAHQALKGKALAFVHTFHSNPIQKRISMMKKMQQPRGGIRQYLLLLPLTLLLFGMPVVNAQVGGNQAAPQKPNYDQEIRLLNINEVMEQVGYPAEAKAAGIEGKVIAKIRFDERGNYMDHSWHTPAETLFRDAVNSHISKLRIEPVTIKGKPAICEVTLPFAFKLP